MKLMHLNTFPLGHVRWLIISESSYNLYATMYQVHVLHDFNFRQCVAECLLTISRDGSGRGIF
jgi:hypothetical protein